MAGIKRQIQPVTGEAALSYTLTPGKKFVFEEIRLHLNAASATVENFVITLQSARGTAYDVVLYSVGMNTVQDLVYQADQSHSFEKGDSLVFAWTNTNLRTYGMEIIYKAE